MLISSVAWYRVLPSTTCKMVNDKLSYLRRSLGAFAYGRKARLTEESDARQEAAAYSLLPHPSEILRVALREARSSNLDQPATIFLHRASSVGIITRCPLCLPKCRTRAKPCCSVVFLLLISLLSHDLANEDILFLQPSVYPKNVLTNPLIDFVRFHHI